MMELYLRPATEADSASVADIVSAAFHPTTDTITHHLFPAHLQPSDPSEADHVVRLYRIARKTPRITSNQTLATVAIDGSSDAVVGFSLWDVPGQDDNTKPKEAEPSCTALDREALAELRQVMGQNVRQHFGEAGTKNVWRESSEPESCESSCKLTDP